MSGVGQAGIAGRELVGSKRSPVLAGIGLRYNTSGAIQYPTAAMITMPARLM